LSHSKDIVHPWVIRKGGSMVIVIPKDIKEELGIENGDSFYVKVQGNNLVYRKLK
jgi:antitoxin component of MazEF toxin-antitoxin module